MVRLVCVFLAVVLTQCSCDLFTGSLFPANLVYMTASVDVSDELGSFLDGSPIEDLDYLFHTVTDNDRRDYLFILIRHKGSGDGKLLVFDDGLEKREELENHDLGLFTLYNGVSGLLPSGEEFVQGREVLDGESLEHQGHLVDDFAVLNPPETTGVGFTDETGGAIYGLWVDGAGTLFIDDWDTAWIFNVTTNLGSVGDRSPIRLDFDREAEEAVLFFGTPYGTDVVRYPSSNFPNLDLHGVPSYPFATTFATGDGRIVLGGAQPNLCHYTLDGIVVTERDGEMTRYGFDGEERSSRDIGDGTYMAAFELGGGSYYYLDFEELRLYRARTWWD